MRNRYIYNIACQNAEGVGEQQRKDDVISQSRSPEFVKQKGNLPTDYAPSTGDETQGSAFLAQVKSLLYTWICIHAPEVGNGVTRIERKFMIKGNVQENPMKYINLRSKDMIIYGLNFDIGFRNSSIS